MTPPIFTEHEFRKASRSEPSRECVRVARRDGWTAVRDDKTKFGSPGDHHLILTDEQFDAFLDSMRSGSAGGQCLAIDKRADGTYVLRSTLPVSDGAELTFTRAEIAAFQHGAMRGEFDRSAFTIGGVAPQRSNPSNSR